MTLRIGFDVDDVLFPWYRRAHKVCTTALVTNGVQPTSWHPYHEYGISRSKWERVLEGGIWDGSLHSGRPSAPSVWAVQDLRRMTSDGTLPRGSVLVAITARGETFEGHDNSGLREVVQRQTRGWLQFWGFEFDEVIFSARKGEHELDYLIDDNPGNVRSVIATGGAGWVLDRPWNRLVDLPRVHKLSEYVDLIVGDQ